MDLIKSAGLCFLLATVNNSNSQENFRNILDKSYQVVSSCTSSTNSNRRVSDSLRVNSLEEFDLVMDTIPKFSREDALKIQTVYLGRLKMNLESHMGALKKDPSTLANLPYSSLISDLENAKRWFEITGNQNEVISDLEKKLSMIPYETQMAIAEEYISKNVYPLGVLRSYSLATKELLDHPNVKQFEHLVRTRKGLEFVKQAYSNLDKDTRVLVNQEAKKLSGLLLEFKNVKLPE